MRTWVLLIVIFAGIARADDWQARVSNATADVTDRVVELRHHFHANPELSNREFKTAEKIARHLRSLGFDEVIEGVTVSVETTAAEVDLDHADTDLD